jgi:hypothetical protein
MHTSGGHTRDGLARIVGCSLFFLSRFHIQAFATLVVHRVLSSLGSRKRRSQQWRHSETERAKARSNPKDRHPTVTARRCYPCRHSFPHSLMPQGWPFVAVHMSCSLVPLAMESHALHVYTCTCIE